MRRDGILNAELLRQLAMLAHTDTFVIADCGFPVAAGVPVIDLRLVYGVPSFPQVLDAVLRETVVEKATIATEMAGANPPHHTLVHAIGVETTAVAHSELKRLAAEARFIVRTAERTPYSNVLLQAGWIG